MSMQSRVPLGPGKFHVVVLVLSYDGRVQTLREQALAAGI